MLAAVIFIWGWALTDGKVNATFTALREKPDVLALIALGAVIGPLLGVSASLLAVQHAEVGVASTLMACTKSHTFFSRDYKCKAKQKNYAVSSLEHCYGLKVHF